MKQYFLKRGGLNIKSYRMFEKTLKKSPKSQKQEQKEARQGDTIKKKRYPINLLVP